MNRLRLMSLTAAAAICIAPLAWAMGPSDRDEQTGVRSAAAAPAVSAPKSPGQLVNACTNGEKIDGSTQQTAKAKIESAGFVDVHGLRKGCDNFWHGMASKAGRETGVVLTTQGEVMPEGD